MGWAGRFGHVHLRVLHGLGPSVMHAAICGAEPDPMQLHERKMNKSDHSEEDGRLSHMVSLMIHGTMLQSRKGREKVQGKAGL